MTIGFHYHIPVLKKEDGSFYTSGAIGVFIDSIAVECDELICFFHTALSSEIMQMDYRLEQTNIKIIEIGPHNHFFKRIARTKKIVRTIELYLDTVDIMLIRGPSPLLPVISALCEKRKKPYAYLLVGDYVKSLAESNLHGIKRFILEKYYDYNKRMQDKFARQALVFANSTVLYKEYCLLTNNVHAVKTTTLKKEDFFLKNETTLHEPVELLYTGRIEPAKGLDEVLEAMSILRHRGINTVLNLVGWEDKKGYIEHLMNKSENLNLDGKVVFHGKKKVGKELFLMYRAADIYVIASKGNEGFPRTVWEAMANSLPVVASQIGSIPHFLDDGENVLLTEPGDIVDIVDKIRLLIVDKTLRRKLIKNAFMIAQDNTLDKQASNIKLICKEFIKGIEK